MAKIVHLRDRGILEIAGADRVTFLQGLVSNDVTAASPGRAVWAALLTPQGKWIADFFIFADGERLLLDCERLQTADIASRLLRFKLRSQIAIQDKTDEILVHAAWDSPTSVVTPAMVTEAPDPRLAAAGTRILTNGPIETNATVAEWDAHRLSLGLPDGTRDLEAEKTTLLEAGFDELSGVSWTKGCYMGQELTARTKYRGLVKRRLIPVTISGSQATPGDIITRDGNDVGTLRSVLGDQGLALLRIDALDGELTCNNSPVLPVIPNWMKLSSPKAAAAAPD
jgi:folate-binding protein YgfZ